MTSLGRSCSHQQLCLHVIQNCRIQVICQVQLSVCNAEEKLQRSTANKCVQPKKNIKTSKIRLYSVTKPSVNVTELFIFCKKAKAHYSQIDLLSCSFKTSFLLFKTSTTMIKICDFVTLLCGNKVSQNATTVSSENEDRKRAAKRFEFPSCWWLL